MEFIRKICFEKYAETMSLAANIYLPAQCVCSNFFFQKKGITPAPALKKLLIVLNHSFDSKSFKAEI